MYLTAPLADKTSARIGHILLFPVRGPLLQKLVTFLEVIPAASVPLLLEDAEADGTDARVTLSEA